MLIKLFLFFKLIFGTWYEGDLFSLMLCKQFEHMYNVELGFILIWKYLKSFFNIFFEICLICFLK
jgi:hypothetical protein